MRVVFFVLLLSVLAHAESPKKRFLKVKSQLAPRFDDDERDADAKRLVPRRQVNALRDGRPDGPSGINLMVSVGQSLNLSDSTYGGPSQGYSPQAAGTGSTGKNPGGGRPPRPGGGSSGGPPMGFGGGMMMGGGMDGGMTPMDPSQQIDQSNPFASPTPSPGFFPADGDGGPPPGGGMGGGMMMMGGGGPGALGGGGTSTNLAARLGYSASRDFNLNLSAGTSIAEDFSGTTTTTTQTGLTSTQLSGGATLRASDEVTLSANLMSQLSATTDPRTLIQLGANWRASDDISLGLNYSQMIGYQGVDDTFGVNGPRTPTANSGGLGNSAGDLIQDTTTLSARATYSVSRDARLGINVPVGFQNGILDPTAFFNVAVPVERRRKEYCTINLGIGANLPLSARSQEESRITTLTGSFGPQLGYDFFNVGLNTQVSYALYNGNYVATTTSSAPDLFRSTNNMSLGFRVTREVRTQSSAGINFVSRRDGTISWGAQATPLSVTYSPGALGLSAYFSLNSDRTNDQAITSPNQPMVGASVSYTFGQQRPGPFGPPSR